MKICWLLGISFACSVLFINAVAVDLTGDWSCSLGGDYYIRQQGNSVMWYGEAAAINPYFPMLLTGGLMVILSI